ncbi:hypothetical protein AVJ23_01635 [Pseudoponticoccus marisrubri]|uniref:Anti-sigma K factor RskA C-terminal domain-containing protein n=1 Tax=Pseudoponticoccus marisrubri TaxID=1685382 RepID=A0A0W7WPF2_9RHOB|nr:hypothetical protein AVJ23_01635 [Pseudoponticoccus marisrubri]
MRRASLRGRALPMGALLVLAFLAGAYAALRLAAPPPVSQAMGPAPVTVLSPDLNRASAVVWLSPDRRRVTVELKNLAATREAPLAVWLYPPQGAPQRLGRIDGAASFDLPAPAARDTRLAVVLDKGRPGTPGPWALMGDLP